MVQKFFVKLNMRADYYIYVHVNKLNNKKYYGLSCQKTGTRWGKNGGRYLEADKTGRRRHEVFARAIEKYGWDGFDHIILETGLTLAQAKELERKHILEDHTCIHDEQAWGYNMTFGGEGSSKYASAEERRNAYLAQRKKHYQKVKSNEGFKEENIRRANLWLQSIKGTEKYAQKRQRAKTLYQEHRQDTNWVADSKIKCMNIRQRVKSCREQLQKLDVQYPDVLTAEEKGLIYDRYLTQGTTQPNYHYKCSSYRKLEALLIKFARFTN